MVSLGHRVVQLGQHLAVEPKAVGVVGLDQRDQKTGQERRVPAAPLHYTVPGLVCGDILLPGHKNVKHELVFEESDLFKEHRLVAAPIRGFTGVEEVQPGKPFRFSSKYGTRFYLVPKNTELPKFEREVFDQWPNAAPPVAEIKSLPVTNPVSMATTTLRFAGIDEETPVIERVSHVELDRWGNEASPTRSILVFGLLIAAGLAFCLLAIRRMKASRKRELAEGETATEGA